MTLHDFQETEIACVIVWWEIYGQNNFFLDVKIA